MNIATREQLSVCILRQRLKRSCRDCKYDDRCDPDFRRIMTADITTDTNNKTESEVKINGYQ